MDDGSNGNKLLFTIKTYLVSHLCSPLPVGFFIADMATDNYILKTPLSEKKGIYQLYCEKICELEFSVSARVFVAKGLLPEEEN